MSALLHFPLSLDTFCDLNAAFTWGLSEGELTSFVGATAQLMIRATPADVTPLVSISTTPSPSGQIYLGQAPPGPLGVTVANIAALVAYNASALVAGTLVAVVQPTAYFAWSPGGTMVPDGVSIINSVGGQWLLSATIRFTITQAAMLSLVGTACAAYTLRVTWADLTSTSFLEGDVLVDQGNAH